MRVILDGKIYEPFGDKVAVRKFGSKDKYSIRAKSGIPEKVRQQLAKGKTHNFDNPAVLGIPGAKFVN